MSLQRGTIDTVLWFWVVVLVALIGAIAVVASGRGDTMAEVYDDRPDATVPSGRPLTANDLREVRFNTGVRGYRMDEVDALLARLEAELLEREDDERVQVMGPAPFDPAGDRETDGPTDLIDRPDGAPPAEAAEGSAPAEWGDPLEPSGATEAPGSAAAGFRTPGPPVPSEPTGASDLTRDPQRDP